MADPYRFMNDVEKALAPLDRLPRYMMIAYDANVPWTAGITTANRFGLFEGGHKYLLEAMFADMAAVGLSAAQMAQMIATYLAGSDGWAPETHAVSRYSANQVAVAGVNLTGTGVNIAKIRRRASVIQTTPGYMAVTAATWDAANNLTIVTFDGTIDTGLTALWWGQDPDNAPKVATGQAGGVCGLDSGSKVATANLPALVGDLGSGGTLGAAPAPSSGDAAKGKWLGAGGAWTQTLVQYGETRVAKGNCSGATTLDLATGSLFTATSTGNVTWTFSNPLASGTLSSLVLALTAGGSYTQTWPSGTKWPGGSAPSLSTSGVDFISFFTYDGGTTWYGCLSMKGCA